MLTQQRLQELFYYEPLSGNFFRKKTVSNNAIVGSLAGCKNHYGYLQICIDGKIYRSHRLAWLYVYGEFPCQYIDHINRVKDDNRIVNLRAVNQSENLQNTKIRSNNTSGLKGVSWCPALKKWTARIKYDGKYKSLGYFDDKHDASRAYLDAVKKHHTHAPKVEI